MFNAIHRLLNPHCPHCAEQDRIAREDKKEDKVCSSCETLARQLEIANHEKAQLLNRLLEKPAVQVEDKTPVLISQPRNIPWRVRQQELEAEDRRRAQLLKDAPKPMPIQDVEIPKSTDDLEKEVVGNV